jgi:Tfp pilus assembly protein PilX
MALMVLVVLAALAVAYTHVANNSLRQGRNHARVVSARLQAEGGLAFLMGHIENIAVPANTQGQQLLDTVASALQDQLDGSGNLGGAGVAYDGSTVVVPAIVTDEGAFSATVELAAGHAVRLSVTGTSGAVQRTISVACGLRPSGSTVFDYGLASRGPVRMTGNVTVRGASDPAEASVFSATSDTQEAFDLSGNCTIEGDLYASDPDAYATVSGPVSVGGDCGEGIGDHVHVGVGEVGFPEIDTAAFESYATNVVDDTTPLDQDLTLNNVRIAAGTNPTFTGDVTLNGVVFVEVPNTVEFSGNTTITAVIVTQDAGESGYLTNTIRFAGNAVSHSVAELPDTEQFYGLHDKTGTFLLAPGFGVEFTGNFGTVGGCVAAHDVRFAGNADGVICGPIVSYGDTQFELLGNTTVTIDRANAPDVPPGFALPVTLQPLADTYVEH